MNILHDLKANVDAYAEELDQMPPSDQRAALTAIISHTREMICMADAMSADGRDIDRIVDRIYKQFEIINRLLT